MDIVRKKLANVPLGGIVHQGRMKDSTIVWCRVLCHYDANNDTPAETVLKPLGHYNRITVPSSEFVRYAKHA